MSATQEGVPFARIAGHLSSGRGLQRTGLVSLLQSFSEAPSLTQRGKVLSSRAAKPGRGGRSGKGMCRGRRAARAETLAEVRLAPRLQEGSG